MNGKLPNSLLPVPEKGKKNLSLPSHILPFPRVYMPLPPLVVGGSACVHILLSVVGVYACVESN